VKEPVARYLLRVVRQTREQPGIELGVSPRGALAYFRAVQASAFLSGRAYVTPEDVQALALPVLAHRIGLTTAARYGGTTAASLVRQIVAGVSVPT
jgi:MoxR-like ATPase